MLIKVKFIRRSFGEQTVNGLIIYSEENSFD